MTKFRKVAIEAATKAGKSLLKQYKTLKVEDINKKGRHDLVTKADFTANRIIISTIKKYFPDHDILSEETGLEDNPDEYKWVIDPLDGTTNYIIKSPMFCTALALVHQQEIIISVVYAPVLDEFYIAEKGKGTYLNGKKIYVSKKVSLIESIITLSRTHHKKSH
ncbi:MAG: inositol monophosphatase family protein, partial [bacterium]|nr:inositol monophosphatase family protein [bacterium]